MQISVLLIEDDQDFGNLLAFRLRETNCAVCFQVHRERTLLDALNYLDTAHVDVIIADLGLPDSSGAVTVDMLSSLAPTVPLVVLSAEGTDSVVWDVISYGAEDYIAKTQFETGKMATVILKAIASHYERTAQLVPGCV